MAAPETAPWNVVWKPPGGTAQEGAREASSARMTFELRSRRARRRPFQAQGQQAQRPWGGYRLS